MAAPSRTRIAIIGGGSYQWTPKLLVDFVNTPVVRDADIVLHDIDAAPLPRMVELAQHLANLRGVALTARATTDRRDALRDADFVVVNISTGGFASMRHDLEIPDRYGVRQSVGDTVGPGGVMRALRNIPVFLDIAADAQELCPDAWILNLTNPMTTICRALTRETPLKTIGLCHEITITQFLLSLLLDVGFMDLTLEVGGVNHLPLVTAVDVGGDDGLDRLRKLVADRPGDPAATNALGYTLVDRTRQHKEGLKLIEDALAQTPDSGAVLDSMGWALHRLGRNEDALGYLERAKRRINDPEVDLHLGEILLALNRKSDARDVWAKASERYPDNDELKQRLQKLN